MMYNPQLDTFICVVEAGSFSKAAEELYISAPAVIKQINSLENSLNLQLFERTHRVKKHPEKYPLFTFPGVFYKTSLL